MSAGPAPLSLTPPPTPARPPAGADAGAGVPVEVTHVTSYRYAQPAAEAYLEVRLTPPELPSQSVRQHELVLAPDAPTGSYTDYFGNAVAFFSLPFRHHHLTITNRVEVTTRPLALPAAALAVSVGEARQILGGVTPDWFDYLLTTPVVAPSRPAARWARRYLRADQPLGSALGRLNEAVHRHFAYVSGSTTTTTPLPEIWNQRRGVCQDFAHVLLSILRTAGLPARYVCGYLEASPPAVTTTTTSATAAGGPDAPLVGALATHAWAEVLVPGGTWVGLDPTNNRWCDQRHVVVSRGLDYRDAAPVRGTFKGLGRQELNVSVSVRRRPPPPGGG